MLCGHIRRVLNHVDMHNMFIKYPNIDIFIHTWDDYGFKNKDTDSSWLKETNEKINVDFIKNHYNPVSMVVENNKSILSSLSLVGQIKPIFLYGGQARDDATKYINSQLYTIHKCFLLVKEHEDKNNFKYDAVMKFRFDYVPFFFDLDNIIKNMDEDTIWFPHARHNKHSHYGGGGGCLSCDNCQSHQHHTNDVCDIWYYGKRDLMEHVCNLYIDAPKILERHTTSNLEKLRDLRISHHEKGDFVYINSAANIEKHIVCYYPERLLREHLQGIPCKSCSAIHGGVIA
jgi:hypothetical protein